MFASTSSLVEEGHTVIMYIARDNVQPATIQPGREFNCKFGSFKHSELIGKPYGSKVWSTNRKGFTYLLRPTPELWTLALSHRTQVLYMPDIAFITQCLDVRPGTEIVEAGTGTGSFTHSMARSVGSDGVVHSYEFHPDRYTAAKAEFELHGLTNVKLRHRDVCKNGFDIEDAADAVFLDVPSPWDAIAHARKALRKDRIARICCFSPCMEQVMRSVQTLHDEGFSDVTMYEVLIRNFEVVNVEMPTVGDIVARLQATEARKAERRGAQITQAKKRREEAQHAEAAEDAPATDQDMPVDPELAPDVNDLKRPADDASESTMEAPPSKRVRLDVAPPTPADSPAPALPDPIAEDNEAATSVPDRERTMGPVKLLSAKPLLQVRGHTSYLTFATLLPLSRRAEPAEPAVSATEAGDVSIDEAAAAIPEAAASRALEKQLSKAEMDDLCAGAVDVTQSTTTA